MRVITILESEDQLATEKLRPHLLDSLRPMQLRATKAAYAAADVAINGLMATFAALSNPSDEQILVHLNSVQFCL